MNGDFDFDNDWPSDEELAYREHFGRHDEELSEPDELSAEYQDRLRNR